MQFHVVLQPYPRPKAGDWGGVRFGEPSLVWPAELSDCCRLFTGVLQEDAESSSSLCDNRFDWLAFLREKNQIFYPRFDLVNTWLVSPRHGFLYRVNESV